MADNNSSLSGWTEAGAKEFHGLFVTSTMIFVAVAIVAHILVWMWRPWFPGVDGYKTGSLVTQQTSQSKLT
jgi:light-harvesting complex 1 beta chain